MKPKVHIFLGGLFSLFIWIIAPEINPVYLLLVFGSSFLIDFDHYVCGVIKTGKISLRRILYYHDKMNKVEHIENKRGVKRKGDFHLFHTIEFHVLIGILGGFWIAFFYIFIGMVFHSLTDLLYLIYSDRFYRREYFFFNWLRRMF